KSLKEQAVVLAYWKSADPVVNELYAAVVHDFGAKMRHAPATDLRHAIVKHGTVGITRCDELGACDIESALVGPYFDRLHAVQRAVGAQINLGSTARAELMAVGAVHLQVRTGAGVQVGGSVVRVGEASRWQVAHG